MAKICFLDKKQLKTTFVNDNITVSKWKMYNLWKVNLYNFKQKNERNIFWNSHFRENNLIGGI